MLTCAHSTFQSLENGIKRCIDLQVGSLSSHQAPKLTVSRIQTLCDLSVFAARQILGQQDKLKPGSSTASGGFQEMCREQGMQMGLTKVCSAHVIVNLKRCSSRKLFAPTQPWSRRRACSRLRSFSKPFRWPSFCACARVSTPMIDHVNLSALVACHKEQLPRPKRPQRQRHLHLEF